MWALTTTHKYQFMVSDSSGFTGPYVCWAVLWILQGTLGNSDSQWIITITKDSPYTSMVILIKLTFSSKQRRIISGIFQIFPPSQGTQAMLTQETKKVWTLLQPKPSQRSSTGKVQQCSLTQWLHNHTSCTCAALQHSGRGAAWRSSRHAAVAGRLREHLSGMCVA